MIISAFAGACSGPVLADIAGSTAAPPILSCSHGDTESAGGSPVVQGGMVSAGETDRIIMQPEAKWTSRDERSFISLAAMFASGSLNSAQLDHYRRLRSQRSALMHPMSGEDLMRQFEHDRVVSSLASALEAYVQYMQSANRGSP